MISLQNTLPWIIKPDLQKNSNSVPLFFKRQSEFSFSAKPLLPPADSHICLHSKNLLKNNKKMLLFFSISGLCCMTFMNRLWSANCYVMCKKVILLYWGPASVWIYWGVGRGPKVSGLKAKVKHTLAWKINIYIYASAKTHWKLPSR